MAMSASNDLEEESQGRVSWGHLLLEVFVCECDIYKHIGIIIYIYAHTLTHIPARALRAFLPRPRATSGLLRKGSPELTCNATEKRKVNLQKRREGVSEVREGRGRIDEMINRKIRIKKRKRWMGENKINIENKMYLCADVQIYMVLSILKKKKKKRHVLYYVLCNASDMRRLEILIA